MLGDCAVLVSVSSMDYVGRINENQDGPCIELARSRQLGAGLVPLVWRKDLEI